MDRVIVKLPVRFYEDHQARDCGSTGIVLQERKSFTEVSLDSVAYDDLHSDCTYYNTFTGDDYAWNRGLVLSARATLKRLNDVSRPDGETMTEWEYRTNPDLFRR